MKESRRIVIPAPSARSSILVWSTFGADVVDDLDPLPLLHVVGHQLADDAVLEDVVVDLDREVVEEVRVPEARKSSRTDARPRRCTAPRRSADGRLGAVWM
jgi:hypothetical protein